jgi:CheY-like chemotaxis protein
MPVMDGVEATVRIRKIEGEGLRVPIVAMTAHALQEERTRCLGAGMDDFITKPIDVAMLREVLSRYLPPSAPDQDERAA